MRNLIANEWMTLDGVIQAPGYQDEEAIEADHSGEGVRWAR
jgi:hypothetical protein